jgi:hypothetical protein
MHEEFGQEADMLILCSDGGKGGSYNAPLKETTIAFVEKFSRRAGTSGRLGAQAGRAWMIPVYAWGAGARGRAAPIPLRDQKGHVLGMMRNPENNAQLYTKYDEETLEAIALAGQGAYTLLTEVSDGKRVLDAALRAAIRTGKGIKVRHERDFTWIFLIGGIAVLCLITRGFTALRRT